MNSTYCIFHIDAQVSGVPRLTAVSVQLLQVVVEVVQHLVGSVAVLTHFGVVIW